MTEAEMEKLAAHFNKYFEQDDYTVLHPVAGTPHIDGLLYKPTAKYPYWKLVSMGASDYKMRAPKNSLGDRNEYIMMIDADEDMTDQTVANWYFSQLMEIAFYPIQSNSFLSYGHSVEWRTEGDEEMAGAFIEFPQVIGNTGILRCKMGVMKNVICLQVILLTKAEIKKLLELGPQSFSEYLYPEDGSKAHFICERRRSAKF